ncbi:MAG: hypothetical protein GY839_14160 [candidate division Zixibacteria bacterium]|nr:hypothetical protein [candidate division Zixibacteria bacterium]
MMNSKLNILITALLSIMMFLACSDKGEEPENRAPSITSSAAVIALIDDLFSYSATASDADGTAPAIHFENIPSWLDTNGNTISGTPTDDTPDTAFTVVAADDFLADTLRVTIDVTDVLPSVSYSDDIQPVFNNSCDGSNCHIGGSASGLRLNTWTDLMAGGNSGDVVLPGDASMSILVRRLEGDIQPQMPLDDSPLPISTRQDVRDWIDEGALNN